MTGNAFFRLQQLGGVHAPVVHHHQAFLDGMNQCLLCRRRWVDTLNRLQEVALLQKAMTTALAALLDRIVHQCGKAQGRVARNLGDTGNGLGRSKPITRNFSDWRIRVAHQQSPGAHHNVCCIQNRHDRFSNCSDYGGSAKICSNTINRSGNRGGHVARRWSCCIRWGSYGRL